MSSPFLIWWFAINRCIAIHMSKVGPSSLPRKMHAMAIGYDNATNLIWLIGGEPLVQRGKSLISFNLSLWNDTNAFVDHRYPLSDYVFSLSQAYVQRGGVVYASQHSDHKLLAYDLLLKNVNLINTNPSSVEIWYSACFASIGDWIIYTYLDQTYILTISTQSWKLSGNPIMTEERYHHACVIEPDGGYLYVIGGMVWDTGYMDSIIKLYVKDITNIEKYKFITLADTLGRGSANMAAVLYKTDIYVAGGQDRDDIDVIDTRTESVILWGRLYEALSYASPIIVGSRLYIFGGSRPNMGEADYWQYIDLFSVFIFLYICVTFWTC